MKLSREARRQAKELFQLTLVNNRVDAARLRDIAAGVIESKPRQYVGILKEITRLVRLEVAKSHAVVESAAALAPAEAASIETGLRARFGDISTEFRTNPALLGGVRVRIGSDVWDGSIRSRLESLKTQF